MFCPFCGGGVQETFNYSTSCGSPLPNINDEINDDNVWVEPAEAGQNVDELIKEYFRQGFTYSKILLFLAKYNGIEISLRTLNINTFDNVSHKNSMAQAAYHSVWHTLQMEGIQVPRETFRILVTELDPVGIQERRKRSLRRRTYHTPGPNYVWHVDGYDKLKPYGFPVHGCIDGYSRKPSNQRIESWWSFLRKHRSNWWMNFFKDLIEEGH